MTMPLDDDGEFTELFDANLPRADMVSAPAHGWPGWLVMKGDEGTAGLLDPDFVRGLIEKAAPQETTEGPVTDATTRERVVMPNGITLNGSPADLASFIHKAALAAREDAPADYYEQVVKAKYDAGALKRMASSGAAMPDESYPIGDRDDLDKAIHAVGRGGSSHNAIRKHIVARAKSLGASSMIPDNWNADGSMKSGVSKEAPVASAVAKDLMDAAGDSMSLDDGMDGMDPTVPLAVPCDEDVPGDPTDPGSPAWEAIDAATAAKWLSIAARLKNALGILAEREMLEAASADPSDAENAWDLEDAQCTVDYVISTLAVFAAGEQAEADLGCEMAEMCKALAGSDAGPLPVIEGLAAIAKAGRVLSSANEASIRNAAAELQKVLQSLPSAPQAETVTKEKEAAMAATATTAQAPAAVAKADPRTPEEQARDTGPVQAGGTTGMGLPRTTGPAAALPGDGPQQSRPGDVPGRTVIKALRDELKVAVYDRDRRLVHVPASRIYDGIVKAGDDDGAKPSMQAVFDENGNLVGICDPADITPVSGAGGGSDDGMQPGPAAAAADDMTPQPAAAAGIPADAVGKSAGEEDVITVTQDTLDSIIAKAVTAALGAVAPAQDVAKQADVAGALAEVELLKARLATVEKHPAAPGVFTNGAVPPQDARPLPGAAQLRGQDQGGYPQVDVAKALERKKALYGAAGAPEQDRIFKEMRDDAVTALAAIHAAGRR